MKDMHLGELDLHLQFLHPLELHNQSFWEIYLQNKQLDSHIYFAIQPGPCRSLLLRMHQLMSKLHLKVSQRRHLNLSHVA